jgi:hypothetical protein
VQPARERQSLDWRFQTFAKEELSTETIFKMLFVSLVPLILSRFDQFSSASHFKLALSPAFTALTAFTSFSTCSRPAVNYADAFLRSSASPARDCFPSALLLPDIDFRTSTSRRHDYTGSRRHAPSHRP